VRWVYYNAYIEICFTVEGGMVRGLNFPDVGVLGSGILGLFIGTTS